MTGGSMDNQLNEVSLTTEDAIEQARRELLDPATAARVAAIFRALTDPTRVRIVSALSHSELCVGDLADILDMSQSAVSHQLRTLREMRVVRHKRVGKQAYYTLDDERCRGGPCVRPQDDEHIHDLYHRGLEHVGHD